MTSTQVWIRRAAVTGGDLTHATRAADLAVAEPTVAGDLYTQMTGRAVPYNTPTDIGPFTEEFAPGAFAESLAVRGNLPLHLWHDDNPDKTHMTGDASPIGVATAWHDQVDGLHGVWRLDDTPKAQRAARQVDHGMLPFLSIRFQGDFATAQVTPGRGPGGKDHIRWTRARLLSVSVLSTPAYPTADVTGVRSADPLAVVAAHDQVFALAVDLGQPMIVDAITGTVDDMRVAAGMVRGVIERFGATIAVAELGELALGLRTVPGRAQLAVNLERARQAVAAATARHTISDALQSAHLEHQLRQLPPSARGSSRPTPPPPARRRRRRT